MKKVILLIFSCVIIITGLFILLENNSVKPITNRITPYPTVPLNSSSIATQVITPSSSRNIEVLSPLTGDKIKSGFSVKGNARVFENVVSIRLSDSSGNILSQTTSTANSPDTGEFGAFEKNINFKTKDTEGKLEVYQVSAKDGSEIDKVIIPVQVIN